MAFPQVLADLRGDHTFMANVVAWQTLPARRARPAPIPPQLHPLLTTALQQRGIERLYSHQAVAIDEALAGHNLAVVTPTASGKTLCYNLPVLHTLLADPDARSLYLFPTKALAQDQLAELRAWASSFPPVAEFKSKSPASFLAATYDGDTPSGQRVTVRQEARIILTNPDMLHAGILPYHTNWADFFAHLRYVVIDEMHTYRGVFGSHVANVLRRLQRICALNGSQPHFICTSATIANPGPLAERLIEQPVTVIDQSGAPQGEKHIILYNPPLVDAEQGIRRSSRLEVQDLAARIILGGVQTIVFGRSRMTTEVLLTYIRERMARAPIASHSSLISHPQSAVRGYRGGYLPNERRAIEAGLRDGTVQGVVATNALELGIDIGQLQAAILCGYPGTIASTWQQMGRSGRTTEASLAILVATADLLDQYIIQHPEFIFARSPERALIHPDNLMLLVDQVRCAAFELPFRAGDRFGACAFTDDVLALLAEEGDVQAHQQRYFWSGEGYPARQVSLRSIGGDSVLVHVEHGAGDDNGETHIIGEVDDETAPLLLHKGAIYIHEGSSHLVASLDLEQHLARVTPVDVDYYTTVGSDTTIDVLTEYGHRHENGAILAHGDLLVRSQVVGYRRVKRYTHETLGTVALDYPPRTWETSGYWFSVTPETQSMLERAGQWYDSPNEYGPNWQEQRTRVRARDGYRCTQCGLPEAGGRQHDVHHLIPFRTFGYVVGLNENYREANRLDNLVLVCRSCHQRLESAVRVRGGLDGLAYTLHQLAPLHLMCDARDIMVSAERMEEQRSGGAEESPQRVTPSLPTIYVYERIAVGLGFGAQLFDLHEELLTQAQELIEKCPCVHGCPSCVGPVLEDAVVMLETKRLTVALLRALRGEKLAAAPQDHVSGLNVDVVF